MISDKELKGMHSPIRKFSLKMKIRSYRKKINKHGIKLDDLVVLDAGCGPGFSTQEILRSFSPKKIYAFDYLDQEIQFAKQLQIDAEFWVGSITNLIYPTNTFDFIFVFNVLHHVPEWRIGIQEIARVIKNEGYVIFEEPTGSYTSFTDRLARIKHPEEGKFSKEEFITELAKNRFTILDDSSTFFGRYLSFICKSD